MKKYKLKNVKLDEISLVDVGANQGAFIVLAKRDDNEGNDKENILKSIFSELYNQKVFGEEVYPLLDTLAQSLQVVFDTAGIDKKMEINRIMGDFQSQLAAVINTTEDNNMQEVKLADDPVEEVVDTVESVVDETPIEKADPTVELTKKLESLQEVIKRQEEELSKAYDERVTAEWIKKCESIEKVGEPDSIGVMLKKVASKDKDLATELFALFEKLNAQIEQGYLFKEAGAPAAVETSPYDAMVAKATVLAKGEKITFEQAFAKVYEAETDLRKEYLKTVRSR